MIIKVNGTYSFKVENKIHMCGSQNASHFAYGLPFYTSQEYNHYVENCGGVIPIQEVRKLTKFLNQYVKTFDSKSMREKYYKLSEHKPCQEQI